MKGNDEVITRLNEALKLELGAVNQYWLHFRLLDNWGYKKLAKKERKEVDRGNASRRSSHRSHHLPRRSSEPAVRRAVDDRREHQGSSRVRSEGRAHRARLLQAITRDLPRPRRLRDDGAVRRPAEGRGRPHRFPRDAARPPRQHRRRELRPAQRRKRQRRATITEAITSPSRGTRRREIFNAVPNRRSMSESFSAT